VRVTRWPRLPIEPDDPSKMRLAILSNEQGHEVVHGRNAHTIGSFSTIKCSCKSKSHIVTNFPMRPGAISNVELAGYGVHACGGHGSIIPPGPERSLISCGSSGIVRTPVE